MNSNRVHSSDVYRLFLQASMSRRVMSEAMAKILWRKCYQAVERADPTKKLGFEDTNSEWDKFLDKIKRLLDPLDLEFARFKDEETGKIMYAITNTKGDEVAQLASDYSPTEIAFFKAIIEQIMLAPKYAYCVSSTLALREVTHLRGSSMSKAQGEVIVASLVARSWLAKSKKGRLSLGTRTVLELSNYLRNTYDDTDLLDCVACMELVTKGYMCPTANCNAPLHKHCYELVLRRRNSCPKCQQEWREDQSDLIPIGEAVVKDKDPKFEKRRVRKTGGAEDEDEDELEESQEMTQTQTQSQNRTQLSQSQSQSQAQLRTQTQTQEKESRKGKKASQVKVNGSRKSRGKKRAGTSDEEEDQLDSMYADDEPDDDKGDDDALDIDNLAEIRERPSGGRRISRRD